MSKPAPTRPRVQRPAAKSRPSATPPDDENHCIICAEPARFWALSPCNNVTCHKCCFRQRALYKRRTCLVCRTDHDDVLVLDGLPENLRFDDVAPSTRPWLLPEYALHFSSAHVRSEAMALLSFACTACPETFDAYAALSEHTKTAHSRQFCDICVAQGNSFLVELPLYTPKQLQRHMNDGDRDGFTGHPRCKFCRNKRFYSDDELNVHIRDRHERCHICSQDNFHAAGYYRNYDDLYDHFRTSHYVCSVPLCVEKRFVVFREDLDLTAHMLKEHGGLTGLNGRLVLGAPSAHFQLLLSTFRPPQNSAEDSLQLKRRRLDERAKHYLHNDAAKIARFNDINKSFRSRKASAAELVKDYEALFSDSDHLELCLLIYELIQLQPPNSDQRTQLQAEYDRMNPQQNSGPSIDQRFPLLSGNSAATYKNLSWAPGFAGLRKTQEEMFPALEKPSRSHTPVNANAAIRYTVIKKKPKQDPKPTIKTFQENHAFKPTYLENSKSESALNVLPKLGQSSTSHSANTSRVGSRSQSPLPRNATLSETRFPALPKSTKKEFPRVKPLPQPSATWGQGLTPSAPVEKDPWGIPIVDKKAEKLKRKSDKASRKTEGKNR